MSCSDLDISEKIKKIQIFTEIQVSCNKKLKSLREVKEKQW